MARRQIQIYGGPAAQQARVTMQRPAALPPAGDPGPAVARAVQQAMQVGEQYARLHDAGVRQEVAVKEAELKAQQESELTRRMALAPGHEESFYNEDGTRNQDAIDKFVADWRQKNDDIARPYYLRENNEKAGYDRELTNAGIGADVQLMMEKAEIQHVRSNFETSVELAVAEEKWEDAAAAIDNGVAAGVWTGQEGRLRKMQVREQYARAQAAAAKGVADAGVKVNGEDCVGPSAALTMSRARRTGMEAPDNDYTMPEAGAKPEYGGLFPEDKGPVTVGRGGAPLSFETTETHKHLRKETKRAEAEAAQAAEEAEQARVAADEAGQLVTHDDGLVPDALDITDVSEPVDGEAMQTYQAESMTGGYAPDEEVQDLGPYARDAGQADVADVAESYWFGDYVTKQLNSMPDGRVLVQYETPAYASDEVRMIAAEANETGRINPEGCKGLVARVTLDAVAGNPSASVADVMGQFENAGIYEALGGGDPVIGKLAAEELVQDIFSRWKMPKEGMRMQTIEALVSEMLDEDEAFGRNGVWDVDKWEDWRQMDFITEHMKVSKGDWEKPEETAETWHQRKAWYTAYGLWKEHRQEYARTHKEVMLEDETDKDEFAEHARAFLQWYGGKARQRRELKLKAAKNWYVAEAVRRLRENMSVGKDGTVQYVDSSKPGAVSYASELSIVRDVVRGGLPHGLGADALVRREAEHEEKMREVRTAARRKAVADYDMLEEARARKLQEAADAKLAAKEAKAAEKAKEKAERERQKAAAAAQKARERAQRERERAAAAAKRAKEKAQEKAAKEAERAAKEAEREAERAENEAKRAAEAAENARFREARALARAKDLAAKEAKKKAEEAHKVKLAKARNEVHRNVEWEWDGDTKVSGATEPMCWVPRAEWERITKELEHDGTQDMFMQVGSKRIFVAGPCDGDRIQMNATACMAVQDKPGKGQLPVDMGTVTYRWKFGNN